MVYTYVKRCLIGKIRFLQMTRPVVFRCFPPRRKKQPKHGYEYISFPPRFFKTQPSPVRDHVRPFNGFFTRADDFIWAWPRRTAFPIEKIYIFLFKSTHFAPSRQHRTIRGSKHDGSITTSKNRKKYPLACLVKITSL